MMAESLSPICLARFLWRSFKCRAWVSGHEFEIEEPTPKNVQVLRCKECGTYSISWTWGEFR